MTDVIIHKPGSAIKAVDRGNGLVEGYLINYGGPNNRDLEGEFFDPQTDLRLDWYNGDLPVLYHHGMDDSVGLDMIGRVKAMRQDDMGLWVQAQLDLANKYAREVYNMIKAAPFGWSSGSIDHLVKINQDGHITRWPVAEASITPTPAMAGATTVRALKALIPSYNVSNLSRSLRERMPFARVDRPGAKMKSSISGGGSIMALRTPTKTHWAKVAQRVLKAKGIRASDEDVNAIAADLEDEYGATAADDDFDSMMADGDFDADDGMMADDDFDTTLSRRSRRSRAMRGFPDAEDPSTMADDDFDSMMADDDFDTTMADDDFDTTMADDDFDTTMSRRSRAARARAVRQALDDDALMADDDFDTTMSRRSRAARARARAVRQALDDDALMADDDLADDAISSYSRRSRGRKSMDDLELRIQALELLEAPGESMVGLRPRAMKSYGGLSVQRDEGDQPGRYAKAFKAYLTGGMDKLERYDKQILIAKGERRWEGDDSAAVIGGSGYKLAAVKALNTSNAGSVGFGVPEDWITELNKNLMAQTTMAADAKVRQTTSDTIIQPDLTTNDARRAYAANVAWPGESPASPTEFDATEIALGQIQVPIHVMLIRMTQTNSALEDVAFDLQAEITEAFSEATAVAYDTLIWSGNGQGKMRGIVVDSRVNDHASTSITTVGGYVAAGSTSAITSGDKLKQMFTNLPSGYRGRAKWYCNSDTLLMISEMKDGIGRYLWGDERGLNGGLVSELMGRPVVVNEFADFVAANAYPLIFADMGRGYLIGKRVEFSVRRFDDSQYAEKDQILFLGRARLGGQIVQPAAFKLLKMSAS